MDMDLGTRISELRREKGMTQEQLAKLVGISADVYKRQILSSPAGHIHSGGIRLIQSDSPYVIIRAGFRQQTVSGAKKIGAQLLQLRKFIIISGPVSYTHLFSEAVLANLIHVEL